MGEYYKVFLLRGILGVQIMAHTVWWVVPSWLVVTLLQTEAEAIDRTPVTSR